MLYTSTRPIYSLLLSRCPKTAQTPTQQQKDLRHSTPLLLGLVCLFSVMLSACATQRLSLTPPPTSGQTGQQSRLSSPEPQHTSSARGAKRGAETASEVFTRGQAALQTGQYENAIALFDQAIQLDTTNAVYYLWLGRAYGHQAEQVLAGEQFFLARHVRKNLEKAVALNPELIEARLDLMTYYLQAPMLLGGGIEKAEAQAGEISKRNPHQGALAWKECQKAAAADSSLLSVSR